MTNKDLINQIASNTSMTKMRVEELLSATVAVLQKELLSGKSVLLQNFGTLEMQRKSARTVVHPKTKEATTIPEKMQLTFKASNTIKEQLKKV